jgi:hypothetical protein
MAAYGTVNRDYGIQLVKTDPEGDTGIYMLNFMKYRERAVYAGQADEAGYRVGAGWPGSDRPSAARKPPAICRRL